MRVVYIASIKIVQNNQDFVLDLMKFQIETPALLIDIGRIGLDKIEPTANGGLKIGALVTNTDLAADPYIRKNFSRLYYIVVRID